MQHIADLSGRHRPELVEFGAQCGFADGFALGREIASDLADDGGFPAVDRGRDQLFGIDQGIVAALAELLRHPQAKQLVAAGDRLELLLLVERKSLLEGFFTLVEGGHEPVPILAVRSGNRPALRRSLELPR